VEVVRLAAPCAEKQLLAMGVDANETTKLVAALTAVKAQQAKDVFDAAVSLVRGEWTQVALTKLLVALQLPMPGGHTTEKVTSKNAAKAITLLAAPCVRKFLVTMGVESKALATGSVGAAEMCSALRLIMNDGPPGEAEFGTDLGFREVLVALGTNEAEIAEAQITAGLMRGASYRQQSLSQSPLPAKAQSLGRQTPRALRRGRVVPAASAETAVQHPHLEETESSNGEALATSDQDAGGMLMRVYEV
jgi:hypothetical protein